MKFLNNIKENTRIILTLSRRLLELESREKGNYTNIENIKLGLLNIRETVKELEKDVKAIDDYTDILSRRIAKLKGKDNEKKDNLTGQEDINL